jgi:hypothetical protein
VGLLFFAAQVWVEDGVDDREIPCITAHKYLGGD